MKASRAFNRCERIAAAPLRTGSLLAALVASAALTAACTGNAGTSSGRPGPGNNPAGGGASNNGGGAASLGGAPSIPGTGGGNSAGIDLGLQAGDVPIAGSVLSCVPTAMTDTACLSKGLNAIGRRAFRRPLTTDETARFVKLAQTIASGTGGTVLMGLQHAVWAMLQSPSFLYRVELGVASAADGGRLKTRAMKSPRASPAPSGMAHRTTRCSTPRELIGWPRPTAFVLRRSAFKVTPHVCVLATAADPGWCSADSKCWCMSEGATCDMTSHACSGTLHDAGK